MVAARVLAHRRVVIARLGHSAEAVRGRLTDNDFIVGAKVRQRVSFGAHGQAIKRFEHVLQRLAGLIVFQLKVDVFERKQRNVASGRRFPAVAALKAEGLGATEIAKRLKIGRASVYRVLEGV
jgi:hypothetical protein